MKIYISTEEIGCNDIVRVSTIRPVDWSNDYFCYAYGARSTSICRKVMNALLVGSGKRLPRRGSKVIVEVELTAK